MKQLWLCSLLAAGILAGCSKNGGKTGEAVKFEGFSVAAVANGAKTKAGAPVDAYEITSPKGVALLLIIGGGKLENNGQFLTLDGHEFLIDNELLKNSVIVVDKNLPAPLPLPEVLPEAAKAKCSAGNTIDLPLDELLARPRPGLPKPR